MHIGKYSLYWSSETTSQKYSFAFKNLCPRLETPLLTMPSLPQLPSDNTQIWCQPAPQKKGDYGPAWWAACAQLPLPVLPQTCVLVASPGPHLKTSVPEPETSLMPPTLCQPGGNLCPWQVSPAEGAQGSLEVTLTRRGRARKGY